jgi:hypothetical protein
VGTECRGSGGTVGGLTSHPQKIKKKSKKLLTNSFIHVIIISERNERGKEK